MVLPHMLLDLNIVLGEGSEEPLPDLNQEPADDGDQFHPIKEAQVHPLKGQSHYLQKEQDGGVHAIDLNVAACKGQDGESYEGNVSLNCIITIDGENDMILHPQNTINIPHNKRK